MKNLEEIMVIKKDGRRVVWDANNIVRAVQKSSERAINPITTEEMDETVQKVEVAAVTYLLETGKDSVKTAQLHQWVMEALEKVNPTVHKEYAAYRYYVEELAKAFLQSKEESDKVLFYGSDENANKDSTLNSTKAALVGENTMKNFMQTFEYKKSWLMAHLECWIHIHDLPQRYLRQINCCLFDMANLLKNGFSLTGVTYFEVKSVLTALSVIGDATLSASAQQFGGFTIPEIDTVLAPYAEKTFKKELEYNLSNGLAYELAEKMAYERTLREIEQGYQGFETKLNTVSNALGQVPFVTITMGLNTSKWAREITKTILKVRTEGMGVTRMTAIFPKIVMLHRTDVMGVGAPNEDIFEMGVECSRTRLYPDWLSLDNVKGNNLGEVYERSGKAVSPMGCRAYLSPFYKEDGEEIYTGRFNIGAVSLNLPKMALAANGDQAKFYELIDFYSQMAFEIHEDYYEKVGKMKGATNPLLFCEGGAWKSVGYDEPIAPIVEAATASLGYIGLEEVCQSFYGEGILKHGAFALDVVTYLKNKTVEATKKYHHLYALYATPAESLCYRFNKANRKEYGVIENVTSREYLTNSFHVHVTEDISIPQKIAFESPFQKLSTGGRISYTEFVYGVDANVLAQSIRFAMGEGLYYGVNVISATCSHCGHQGDFDDQCPKCGATDITSISRVCGYLSYGKSKGHCRYNPGKQAEVKDRIKHSTKGMKLSRPDAQDTKILQEQI